MFLLWNFIERHAYKKDKLKEIDEVIGDDFLIAGVDSSRDLNQKAYQLLQSMKNMSQMRKPGVSDIQSLSSSF